MFDFWKWLVRASLRGIAKIPIGAVRLSKGTVKQLKRIHKPRDIFEWLVVGWITFLIFTISAFLLEYTLKESYLLIPIGFIIFVLMFAYGYYLNNVLRE